QVRETSIHKTSGFSSYFFHTLIKQRRDLFVTFVNIMSSECRYLGCTPTSHPILKKFLHALLHEAQQ
ncbi:hypothetical protein, partial [Microcoleus sp. AT9b-C3]|uniref:hypothetical protein n=1 Tax=Microcoleus sp. AT9b-C3 TaxID=2818629 RepID=UPI002FCF066F